MSAQIAAAEQTYPATLLVHCPQGPEPCCEKHARGLMGLMRFMGAHTVAQKIDPGLECNNCRNEAKK